ncbi:DUF3397 domain-containing protein [Alkalicoccobacillus murimartini]|uniref:Signal transduction histidine kinase n=1 Tax=Alkalicoccobacillus murimartini TaxID=171685 RepID=A0ABT9YF34_9BACI|nr:DUF3397 domain-containing protein [Alkalicoccobacillus murimartini]MDQ0206455.1 signal transduction histidine kinase [Alkalicoccobacillus murimartini]
MLTGTLAGFIATVITVPVLGWYLIYITTVKLSKHKPTAIKVASDVSSILFMVAVYYIMAQLWSDTSIWLIFALFFAVAFAFTIIYWKVMDDFYASKLFKGIWRLNFLLFVAIYILLSGYGLLRSIFYFV